MDTKHTPGPWKLRSFDEGQVAVLPVSGDRNPLICTVSVGYGRPDGEANARLIGAAPELLQALCDLFHDAKDAGSDQDIDAALDKAEPLLERLGVDVEKL